MTKLLLRLFVKDYRKKEKPAVRSAVGRLSGVVGILCNCLLFGVKLFVGVVTGSVSVTADALNNLSDATGSVVTLIGFRLSEMPADEDHPYGHARYEYLSGLAVAAMIIVIGFELAKSSVEKIISPTAVTITWPMAIILIGSVAVKLWMFAFNRYLSRHIDSAALAATAVDSRNDAVTTLAVLAATGIELLTKWRVDGYMGLAVALFIFYSGWNLIKETISPLLGEAASPQLRKVILEVMEQEPHVLGYHDFMVHDYGPGQRFGSIHVEMDQKEDPLLCHEIIDNLERLCLKHHGVHLVIHYDPVVTGDAEMEAMRCRVTELLQQQDARITIHDFRMVRGGGHTNLIFDIVLPAELMGKAKEIKAKLDADLAEREEKAIYTVVTFDLESFNEK